MTNSLSALVEAFSSLKKSKPILFLDYDGTLVDIIMNPEDALADTELINDLKTLSGLYDLYIVTGRSLEEIDNFIGKDFNVIVLHGAIARRDGRLIEYVHDLPRFVKICDDLYSRKEEFLKEYPGLRLYNKHGNILFHMGLMKTSRTELLKEVESLGKRYGMDIYRGKMIVELRIPGVNKGTAIKAVRAGRPCLIAGDDRTDEDAFLLNPDAMKVKVGQGETMADYSLSDPKEMRLFLKEIIEISR